MTFIEPALASRFEAKRLGKGSWLAEEKFDGHRLLFRAPEGVAWSRLCNERKLPPHLTRVIGHLPPGVYDGELIRRTTDIERANASYDVSRIERPEEFRIVVFDMLEDGGVDLTSNGIESRLIQRRERLVERLSDVCPYYSPSFIDGTISIAPVLGERVTIEHLAEITGAIWNRKGEGIMLKEMTSSYRPGKRMLQWLKIKRKDTTVGELVGFQDGLMGPHSVAVVKDDEGRYVYMKAKDHDWLRRMDEGSDKYLGRRVIFEYTERTPSGSYREPRWDRFEDE